MMHIPKKYLNKTLLGINKFKMYHGNMSFITSNYIPINSSINVLKPSIEGDKDSIYDNCIYATMSMPFSVYDLDLGIKKNTKQAF